MNLDAEIEKLEEELAQEEIARDVLEASSQQAENLAGELDKQVVNFLVDSPDIDSEWKDKFEEQFECNQSLEKQFLSMQDKMKEMLKIDADENDVKETSKVNNVDIRQTIRQLEREKIVLDGKLRDYEWRLDSEAQALSKLNEDKKKYKMELTHAVQRMDKAAMQSRTPLASITPLPGLKFQRKKSTSKKKQRLYGLPDNHRIIDPSKGPIKKTAAVKILPKLKTSSSVDNIASNNKQKQKENRKTKSSDGIQLSESLSRDALDPRNIETQ